MDHSAAGLELMTLCGMSIQLLQADIYFDETTAGADVDFILNYDCFQVLVMRNDLVRTLGDHLA